MGMQFADEDGEHDNVIALAFRKPVSHKANNVTTLAKEIVLEFLSCEFVDLFSSTVQYLDASSVANELHVDKVECGTHQGDKVRTSAVGELARTANKVSMCVTCILLV